MADIEEARVMAIRFLGQVLLEQANAIKPVSFWSVEVRGENRKPLFRVDMSIEDQPVS